MEHAGLRFLITLGTLALLVAATGIWWAVRPSEDTTADLPIPGEEQGILVEVLNGTQVDGLARSITRRLRTAGIDVVYFGSDDNNQRDTTILLVRRGDSTVAGSVLDILGIGTVRVQLDSLRLLDVTVLLGRDLASARGTDP